MCGVLKINMKNLNKYVLESIKLPNDYSTKHKECDIFGKLVMKSFIISFLLKMI